MGSGNTWKMKKMAVAVLLGMVLGSVTGSIPAAAYESRDAEAPTIRLSAMDKAPTIDGTLAPGEWEKAACTNVFHKILSLDVIKPASKVWIGYDAANIYVAAEMPVVSGKKPVAISRDRDDALYLDDALEVFLDPLHNNSTSYQFVVNAAGSISDMKDKNSEWNGNWKSAVSSKDGVWFAEICIPLDSIGIKLGAKETTVGFNICLDRKDPDGAYSWAPLTQEPSFHQPGKFGHLILSSGNASPSCLLNESDATFDFDITNSDLDKQLAYNLSLYLDGKLLQEANADIAGSKKLSVGIPTTNNIVPDGVYIWKLTGTNPADNSVVYRHTGSVTIKRSASMSLRKYFIQGKLGVDAKMPVITDGLSSFTVIGSIEDASGVEKLSQTKYRVSKEVGFDFDISKLPCTEHKAVVTVKSAAGEVISRVEQTYIRPEKPDWLGSKAGITDKVLAPWTPIKLKKSREKLTASVWGRTYTFTNSPFPFAVLSQKASIFKGPIAMSMVVDGKPIVLKGDLKVTSSSGSQVKMEGKAKAGNLIAYTSMVLDYDGNAYVDLKFNSNSSVRIDKFSIEIPIDKRYAEYRAVFPTVNASTANSRAIPAEGWESGFVSYLWVGDEDRGFALYTTSDQHWTLDTQVKPASVKPVGKDTMLMAFNIISKPVTFTSSQMREGIKYQFGYEATPVKKADKDVWDYGIVHSGEYGIENMKWTNSASISYDAAKILDSNTGTIDMFVKVNFDPNVEIKVPEERGAFNQQFMTISNGWNTLILYWNIDDRGMRYYFVANSAIQLLGGAANTWNKGEIHRITLTWNERLRLYVDNKLTVDKPWTGLMGSTSPAASMVFTLGNPGFGLDEIKISKDEIVPDDTNAAFVQDQNTLMLDHLGSVKSIDANRANTSPDIGTSGYLTGIYKFADMKYGKGIDIEAYSVPLLDHLKNLGYKTMVFHEHWTEVQNYPEAVGHEEDLKKFVKVCHEKGFQVLLYFGYEMADNSPTWFDYKDECLVAPTWQSYTRSNPPQKDYVVCYNSVWQDFIADGVAKVIDKYDIDGVYLDSTAIPWWCNNTYHGCGYERPDGTLGVTFAYKGARDMLRRLYTVVKTKKPDGQVNLHNSGLVTVPATGWATSTWDGEHLTVINGKHDIDEVIPLDSFRAEFMGRNFGSPAEFLCYDTPYTFHEAFTMTLLHDVLVRARGYAMSEQSLIMKTMEAFGRKAAEFKPYWNNSDMVSVKGEKAYASLYVRKGKGVMCVVSSFSKKTQDVEVKLNLGKMKLSKNVSAVNQVNGDALPMVDGTFKVKLNGVDYALVWVK